MLEPEARALDGRSRAAGMFESILLEATDALLRQQAEIKRLHSIISWCQPRLAGRAARELETLLGEMASKPPPMPTMLASTFGRLEPAE